MAYDEVALVKNLPGGSDVAWERYARPQRYYTTAITGCTAPTTLALTASRLYAIPFLVSGTHTFIRLAITVSTLSAGNARMGIYTNTTGDLYPNALVAGTDVAEVSTGTTGLKETTISWSPSPGLYWLCVLAQATPTVRAIAVGDSMPTLGLSADFSVALGNAWYVAYTYAALPATYPGGGTINTAAMPLVALLRQ
jgi:hypothetical protein